MLFGVMCLISTVLLALIANPKCYIKTPSGVVGLDSNCPMTNIAALFVLITDIISDAILIGIPLYILRRVKLPAKEKRMILSIFAASWICSMPSVAYMFVTRLANDPMGTLLVIYLKLPVTLLICNLLVIVMYLYSRFWRDEDGQEQITTTPNETAGGSEVGGSGSFTDTSSTPGQTLPLTAFTTDVSHLSTDSTSKMDDLRSGTINTAITQ